MKRLLFIFSFFFLFVLNGKTQEVEILTLEDCLRIGIDNNLSLEGKRKEIQKSKYGVSENRLFHSHTFGGKTGKDIRFRVAGQGYKCFGIL